MLHFIRLHLTTLDKRSKAGRKRKPATSSEHLLVGMKIAIPVLPSIGAYISDDARSCVNDDCFDLPAFSNRKFQSGKKSDFGDFASSSAKSRDDHQNLKLLSIDLNQMHLIGLVERTILVFKSSKSDVSLQSYGL